MVKDKQDESPWSKSAWDVKVLTTCYGFVGKARGEKLLFASVCS